jgi:BirA family biotin operon repressor/biotin-[acetyl-CoA-carboxylase] ligase
MLEEDRLRTAALGGLWTSLDVVARTGSTNADLLERAAADPAAAEGQILVAEEQTAGRGRLGRSWESVPGTSLTFSVLLFPEQVPPGRRGWLTLLTGVAVAAAVGATAAVDAGLKWPNDVLIGERKLAGILAEQAPARVPGAGVSGAGVPAAGAVVVGIGLNVTTPADALPVSPAGVAATSLLVEGAPADREDILLSILSHLERWYTAFRDDPDPARTGLLGAYRERSATLGRAIRAELPGGRVVTGTATGIDDDGSLLVTDKPGNPPTSVAAGDVIHVR